MTNEELMALYKMTARKYDRAKIPERKAFYLGATRAFLIALGEKGISLEYKG